MLIFPTGLIGSGKGGKVRKVLLGKSLWQQLQSLKGESETEAVFVTSTGNRLDRHKLHRLIKAAAERAGVNPLNLSIDVVGSSILVVCPQNAILQP